MTRVETNSSDTYFEDYFRQPKTTLAQKASMKPVNDEEATQPLTSTPRADVVLGALEHIRSETKKRLLLSVSTLPLDLRSVFHLSDYVEFVCSPEKEGEACFMVRTDYSGVVFFVSKKFGCEGISAIYGEVEHLDGTEHKEWLVCEQLPNALFLAREVAVNAESQILNGRARTS